MAHGCRGRPPLDAQDDMEERARDLKRHDLFRLNRIGMVLDRLHLPAIYLERAAKEVCESIVPTSSSTNWRRIFS